MRLSARRTFAPNDQRFSGDNLDVKDDLHFVVEGCPPQSQLSDMVVLLRTMKWSAIPQQRRMVRGMADWWVSSASQPPGEHFRWNGHTLLIRPEDPEQLRKDRMRRTKKNMESMQPKKDVVKLQEDLMQTSDPWAKFKSKADNAGRSQTTTSPSASSSMVAPVISSDPRIASRTARMDAYEKKHDDLSGRVGQLDTKHEGLGVSMSEQFSQVMAGLRSLSSQKAAEAEGSGKHPRTS